MNVPGTNMHIVVFIISLFQFLMLFFQVVYYLQRPSDRVRLWFLFLLILLIQYNLAGSLLPDERLDIQIKYQYIYTYFTGIIMSMYIIYYFYKAFDLQKLKKTATYGMLYFVFLPYVFLFAIPYYFVNDFHLFNKLIVIIPGLYAFVVGRSIYVNLIEKIEKAKNNGKDLFMRELENAVVIAASYLFWVSLPVVTYFEGSELLEHSLTNTGFLLMTFSYIRKSIYDSQKEFYDLKSSKQSLEHINSNLQEIIISKTVRIEKLAEEQKNTFINLVHEMKTPLTLINNYFEDYILNHKDDQEIIIIKQNLQKLTMDIHNIFDLDRYKNGFPLYNHSTDINISQRITEIIKLFEIFSIKKGIKINSEIKNDLIIRSASHAFDRIVFNLLDNAIKYSQAGDDIYVALQKEENFAVLKIQDLGIGISKQVLNNIFEPYFQIRTVNKGSLHGMGLGLPMSKNIIDSLNGDIHIKTNPEIAKGTLVVVLLPLSFEKLVMPQPSPFGYIPYTMNDDEFINTEFDDKRKSILLVEDNKAVLSYLRKKLISKYNIIAAYDGDDALRKIKEYPFKIDLIVTDIMMGKMDGQRLIKVLSRIPKFQKTPIVVVSAKDTQIDRSEVFSLGAVSFIKKPFVVGDLLNQIRNIINMSKQEVMFANDVEKSSELVNEKYNEYNITSREIEIIKLLKDGFTNKLISAELHISINTVNTHISNIYEKVGVNSKIALIKKLEIEVA